MLLHGQPGAGIGWHRVIGALGDDVEVLAPDRPGYGQNPLPPGGIEANVDWLAGVLGEPAIGAPPVLVAHSWAGAVALAFARRHPDAARALVLVGSVGPGAVTPLDRFLAGPLGAAATRWGFWLAHPVLRRAIAHTATDDDTRGEMLLALRANRSRGAWRTFLAEQQALVGELPGVLEGLGGLTVGSTVVAGTHDHIVRFATAEALAAQLPRAELLAVPGGGHQLHRTHAEVIVGAVRRALVRPVLD